MRASPLALWLHAQGTRGDLCRNIPPGAKTTTVVCCQTRHHTTTADCFQVKARHKWMKLATRDDKCITIHWYRHLHDEHHNLIELKELPLVRTTAEEITQNCLTRPIIRAVSSADEKKCAPKLRAKRRKGSGSRRHSDHVRHFFLVRWW